MAIAVAQWIKTSSGSTAVFTGNTTTGNALVACITTNSGTISASTVATPGNSLQKITSVFNTTGPGDAEIWYLPNITGETTPTVTVTWSGTAPTTINIDLFELSGVTILDKSTTGTGKSNTLTVTSATPAYNNSIVIGCARTSSTFTLTGGFANVNSSAQSLRSEYTIQTTATAITSLGTASSAQAQNASVAAIFRPPQTFYVSPTGLDSANGITTGTAWQTVAKANTILAGACAGDTILFQGGQTFTGTKLYINSGLKGSSTSFVTIGSYGSGRATISMTGDDALYAYRCGGISISNINFVQTASPNFPVIFFYNDIAGAFYNYIRVDSCDITGSGYDGIEMYGNGAGTGYNDARFTNLTCHGNNRNGLLIWASAANTHTNIYVGYSSFYSNLGITGGTSSDGIGLNLQDINGGTAEYCAVYSNGGNHNNATYSVDGVLVYQCNNITIQNCEVYSNAPASGGGGGLGIDIDSQTSNSIVQNCYVHDNFNTGIQLSGCGSGNIVRYNICQNNSNSTSNKAEITLAGASTLSLASASIYNNTLYSSKNHGLYVANTYIGSGNVFENNIVYLNGAFFFSEVSGAPAASALNIQYNLYYNYPAGGAYFYWNGTQYSSLAAWKAAATGQGTGDQNTAPNMVNPGGGGTINSGTVGITVSLPANLQAYMLAGTTIVGTGMTVSGAPATDFYGGPVAATPGANTTFINAGTMSATEPSDTANIAGTVFTNATLSSTEAADTAAISGTVLAVVSGTLSATEPADTAAISGKASAFGPLSATEPVDTAAISGNVGTIATPTAKAAILLVGV